MAATIRRLYLYTVAFISLDLLVGSVLNLVRILADRLVAGHAGSDWQMETSFYIALLLVSGTIYVIHWLLCWRFARTRDDRQSTVRTAFLYGVVAVAMLMILYNGYDLLERMLASTRFLYYQHERAAILSLLVNLGMASALWALHGLVLRRDERWSITSPGTYSPRWTTTVRRVYTYLLSTIGLSILIPMLMILLVWCVERLLDHAPLTLTALPSHLVAGIIMSAVVWLGHALWCQRRTYTDPDERQSVLRHAYLYLIAFATTIPALTAVILILKGLLDLILGEGGVGDVVALLSDFNAPASMVVVCGMFWLLHRLLLWRDVRRMDAAPFQVHLRRLHGHLTAGIGLTLTIGGGANLLHAILRMASTALAAGTPTVVSGSALREEISLYATLLLVGLPVWLLHWLRMQRETRPGDPAGVWRRVYLYLVFLSSALVFLFNATWTLYAILNVALGLEPLHRLGGELREPVSNLAIYGVLWGYHLFVLARAVRAERRHEAEQAAAAPSVGTIAVVDDGDGALGARILDRLRQENIGATLMPVGLSLAAAEAMAASLGEVPANADEVSAQVQQADVLVGPMRAFLAQPTAGPFPGLAVVLAASPARRVVLPLADEQHVLVGSGNHSTDALVQQATRWAIQVARGEEPRGGEGLSTGAAVGIAVLTTLLLTYGLPLLVALTLSFVF